MSNIDHAAEVIYRTLSGKYGDFSHHEETVDALADAGLIAPDLPEPRGASPYWKVPTEDGARDALIHLFRKAIVVRLEDGTRTASVLTRDEARGLALALLAAAAHEQKEETNED